MEDSLNITINGSDKPSASLVPFKPAGADGEAGLELMSRFTADLTPEMIATKMAAEVEKKIRVRLKEQRDAAHAISKNLRSLEKKRSDLLETLPRQLLNDAASKFVDALKAFDVHATASYGAASYDKVNSTVTVPFYMSLTDSNSNRVTKDRLFPAPAELVDLQKEIESASEQLHDANLKVRQTNSALLNIGSVEREARSNVIEKIMASSEEGQKVLNSMDTIDVDSAVDYLQTI